MRKVTPFTKPGDENAKQFCKKPEDKSEFAAYRLTPPGLVIQRRDYRRPGRTLIMMTNTENRDASFHRERHP